MEPIIVPTYEKLTPFKRCVLQNFPFIEQDFDALTNYGLLCKIVEYLNNVISSQNQVTDNITLLNNAFIELKDYIDNYFENLDVQEEINNKLDAMAEEGYFDILIDEYVKPKINDLTEYVNNSVSNLQAQVSAAISNPPIPVASVDDMTDTTKIYVNTTNGEWYYHNGSSWVSGGTYQSATYNEDVQFLKSNLYYQSNLTPYLNDLDYWISGGIDPTTGGSVDNTNRMRTLLAFKVQKGTRISCSTGYKFNVIAYDTYIGPATSDFTNPRALKETYDANPVIVTSDCYIKINMGDADYHDLVTDDEFNEYASACLENLFVTAYSTVNLKAKEKLNTYTKGIKQIFALGNLNNSNGTISRSNLARAVSVSHIRVNAGLVIFMNDPMWIVSVGKYDKDLNYLGYVANTNSQEPIYISPTDAKFVIIAVRRSHHQSDNITSDELYEINTKTFIYTKFDETFAGDNAVSGASLTHIVQNNQAGFNFPSISFPTDFDFNKILKFSDYYITNTNDTANQGLCAVNDNLVLTCTHTDTTNVTLIKYNPETGAVLNVVNERPMGHANGIAYVKPLNKIYVAGFLYNVPDEDADWGRVYVVDADTLQYDSDFSVDSILEPLIENYKGIGAVGYCEKRKLIAYLIRDTGSNNRGIAFFDLEGNYVSHFRFNLSWAGGICCLDDYIIVATANKFVAYDYEGNLLGSAKEIYNNTNLISELESFAILNGNIYMSANNATNAYNDHRYANLIELIPKGYKTIDIKTYLGL